MDRQEYLQHKHCNTQEGEWFNPWVTPDEQYIPECRVCAADTQSAMQQLAKLKGEEQCVIMNHTHSCLWYDYFESRILNAYPNAILMWKSHLAIQQLRKAHEQLMRVKRYT